MNLCHLSMLCDTWLNAKTNKTKAPTVVDKTHFAGYNLNILGGKNKRENCVAKQRATWLKTIIICYFFCPVSLLSLFFFIHMCCRRNLWNDRMHLTQLDHSSIGIFINFFFIFYWNINSTVRTVWSWKLFYFLLSIILFILYGLMVWE